MVSVKETAICVLENIWYMYLEELCQLPTGAERMNCSGLMRCVPT